MLGLDLLTRSERQEREEKGQIVVSPMLKEGRKRLLTLEVSDICSQDVSVHSLELLLGKNLELELRLFVLRRSGRSDGLRVFFNLHGLAVLVELGLDNDR